jgi:Mg-chelatase subunit ChlD
MRMRRVTQLLIFLAPVALTATAFVALVRAEPSHQTDVEASGCLTGLTKWVDPESIVLGQTAQVSMLVTGTCPTRYLPVDLVIVADESNSMTRLVQQRAATSAPPATKTTPDPRTPPPTQGSITTPGTPGSDTRNHEPPFCNPNQGGRTQPTIAPKPTIKPTPNPSEPPPPPDTPGPIAPPRTGIAVEPTEDINALEPAGNTDWVREEKSWVRDFIEQPQIAQDIANGRLRVGFVSFNERARIRQPLTDQASKISSAATRMRGGEVTYVQQGLRTAEQMLTGSGSRKNEERIQVILLLSDFQFCQKDMKRASKDIQVLTVGFGVRSWDLRNMFDLATDRRFAVQDHVLRDVMQLYDQVVAAGTPVDMDQLTVRDELADNMALVPNSVQPPTVTVTGQLLEWTFAPPTLPLTLSYGIQPLEAGTHPVSRQSGIDWQDSETLVGSGRFPTVTIEVLPPTPTPTDTPTNTPTPTATDTPTATFTPTPAPQYFPIALKQKAVPTPIPSPTACVPSSQLVDVALVIDTSTSMNQPTTSGGQIKMQAAIGAGIALVNLLKANDQTAVVWFNINSGLASPLTSDKAAAIAALQSLPGTMASGTGMHLGIRTAVQELTSSRHNPVADQSLILLTDGYQSHPDGIQPVYDAAAQAKADGILMVTVGLGMDVDHAMLTTLASDPTLFFHAPNAEDLNAIYVKIASLIPCK